MANCRFGVKCSGFLALVTGLLLLAAAPAAEAQFLTAPPPGSVYRDYTQVMASNLKDWRVTDPTAPASSGSPDNNPTTYLPNSVLSLNIGDLQGAVRAEAIIDVWGGHPGTTNKRFRFNGNAYLNVPELGTTPTSGQCYMQEWNAVVEIPLAHLVQGNNSFEGTSGAQTCYSFNWGQWGWYTITVRVYYDPALKTEPTGSITSPASGGFISANPTISASASSPAGIGKVDFLAYYEGPDFDGDGVYLQYHESYRRTAGAASFVYSGHVGTATGAPYQVTWNTSLVPSQPVGGVKLVARVCDTTGLCTVSPEVTGLTLSRPTRIVKLYKPSSVEERFWISAAAGTTKSATFNITEDLAQALSATVVIPTWNGIDGAIEPGDTHDTKFNPGTAQEYLFPSYGANHHYKLDVLTVPVASLRAGTNTIQFFSDSQHHGIEVLWPGPQLVVTYNNPLANCGNGALNAGEQCDDGNLVSGDGCSATCAIEFCGDTILQAALGEQCDDGNTSSGDGCSATCQREPRCGDGTLDPGEVCDDGDLTNGDGCSQYCRIEPTCGDGVVNVLEACDDGNTAAGDGCTATCAIEQYGPNVVVNGGFSSGTSPWFFNTDQSATFTVVGGEARVAIATPGNNVQLYQVNIALDGSSQYRLRLKGRNTGGDDTDVFLQKHTSPYTNYGLSRRVDLTSTMQQSDLLFTTTAGNKTDARLMFWLSPYDRAGQTYFFDDVSIQKVIVVCGNGFVEGPEQCDDGNLVIGDGCSWGCRNEPYCGDGNVDPGEQCDSGGSNSDTAPNACRTNCLFAHCGDGALDSGETCDGGGATQTCDANCTPAACGDGTVNPAAGEECDNGASNSNSTPNACRTDCQSAGCGDGVVDVGETCDPGAETTTCDANCTPRACGDGTVNATAGETCDDGNTVSGDGCRADCLAEGCGDGVLQPLEQCDDGNTTNEDGCSAACFVEDCGDGIAQLPEQCDDGNTVSGDGCSAACVLEPHTVPNQFRGPQPGDVYKEFSRIIGGTKNWRVTDPGATSPGTGPGNNPAVYLPNDVMQLTVGDLQGAIRAEATIEMWGGHAGTSNKRFRFNNNPYIPLPELQTTPTSGECYTQQWNVTVDVPLAHLVQGVNTFDGTCTGQTCYDNDWGQWGWYGILVRVYYDPLTKAHPTGQVTAPTTGATLGANPLVTASASANVDRVDFLAYYEGVDYDGDGRYLEYHEAYHRLPTDTEFTIGRHVGTDTGAPFQAAWDTSLVPDQDAAHIKLLARIRDTSGVWYVTPEVTNLALVRSGTSVKLYKSEDVPERYWVTNEIFEPLKSHHFTVPPTDNLAAAESAKFIIASWNGVNGAAQPGGTQTTKINAFTVTTQFGANHFYGFNIIDVPTSALTSGENTVEFQNLSNAHGLEVLWPGTQMVVTYTAPASSCGDGTRQAGEVCDDGNDQNGDGCDAYCRLESCGDGVTQLGIGETCDDGNRVAGDGCNEYCVAEICGDGVVQGIEQCDDGNTTNSDGCSSACRFEICGDGIVQSVEECDDGNLVNGDGCQANCTHLPLAEYGFEEPGSGLVAIDATGNGHNGTLVGAVTRTASGYFGRAVDFPGTGGYVDLGNFDVPGSGLTLEMWFRADDFDVSDARLISKATGLNDADHYWMISTFSSSGLRLRFRLQTSVGGTAAVVASTTLTAGQWTHVAATYDGSMMRLYQNGALVGSLAKSGSVATNAAVPVWIGDAPVASTKFFDGRIDEVRIDNRAHGAAEILADMGHPVALCGNGALDPGEQCDNGPFNSNTNPNACRTDCTLPRCGDLVIDLGETCDAGRQTATCDANCTAVVCGDGTVNGLAGEQCDTAGPSATCDSDCTAPVCGDGVRNAPAGEQCDAGAGNSNTTPNACRTNCHTASCGDAVTDSGETCDTGGNSATCDANCTAPACGDGFVNSAAGEQCDTAGNSATCDSNCSLPVCGDGLLNTAAGEQCDNGGANSNTAPNACRTNCQPARCGDAVTDAGEQCDDGNASNTDACRNTCALAICGDGFVRAGVEQCDDGNAVSGDGCGPTCSAEYCGDGVIQPALGEVCDSGAANSDTTPYACREDCQPAACGDGTVDQRPTPPIEFVDDGGLEQWSSGALVQWSTFLNGGEVRQNSTVQRSGASCAEVTRQRAGSLGIYQIVFGLEPGFEFRLSGWTRVNPGAATTGFPTVRVRNVTRNQYLQANGTWAAAVADALVGGVRGDGAWTEFALVFRTPGTHAVTDSYQLMLIHQTASALNSKVFHDDVRLTGPLAEECDDGNLVDRDRCSSSCEIEDQWCGDGATNGPEQCDDANTVQTDACLNACTLARCGDGIVRTGFEQCDDGNVNNADNCSNACVVNFCGDGITQTGRGEECDDANAVNDDVCSNTCLLTGGRCGDGIRQQGLGEQCDDGNAVNNDNCSNACVVNFCGDGIEQTARGEQCDDGNAAIGDGCRPNCTDEACGDGIKDPQEGCDDGDVQSGDGCSAACVVERCGDGIVQGGLGEDCDDANTVNDDLCSNTCQSTNAFCGNGFTEMGIGEQCDDANAVNDDTCNNACQLTGFYCGDGVVQPGLSEQCDDGNGVPDDLCNNLCRFTNAFCGNGQVEHGIGEQCDDGNAAVGDGCRPDCTAEGCGDGIVDPGEECDDGDVQSWDGCQSDCVSDLFLRVDKQHQGGALPPLITLNWTGEHPRFEIYRSINDRTAVNDPFNLMDEVSAYTWPDPGTPATRGFIAYYDVITLCGNGTLQPGEACDDGNNMSLDGCRSNCDTESCGDGMLDSGEDCDDGNLLAGDGCRADCTVEGCGDGRVDPGEECDDGNGASGDGCSAGCLSEDCGNGRLESGEECDDANASNFDACLNSCDNATCGDGYQRTGTEQCDDGDLAGGDGCGATCVREFGWACVGNAPSLCTQNCTDQDGDTFDNCNPGIEGDDGKPADCNVALASCTTDCVTDTDNDGTPNCSDACLDFDLDGFGVGSGCTADNCPGEFNPDQLNSDAGTQGDVCDPCPADAADACNQAQSVGTNVGTAGGTVTTADGRVSIVIPAGALSTDRSISATEGAPGVVAGANGVALASRLLPAAQTFLAPVTASFRWLDADANGIVDGSSPAIAENGLFIFQDGVQLGGPCSDPAYQAGTCTTACCDVATNTWTVRVSHFSTFLVSAAGCGNGVVDPGEACDDGNDVQGDGCHDNCTLPACGDGIVDPGETCDDGNAVTGDGCSAACARLTSDDFSGCGLDPRWTLVNPQNDASFFISGTGGADARLNIVVPAGLTHDALAINGAPRAMQAIDNSNFQLVVKMESPLSAGTQLQGVIVEQDPSNYIRFDFYSNGTRWYAFAAVVKGGTVTSKINQQMPVGASPNPLYLRVTRTFNLWQHEHSTNGTTWTSNGTFTEPLTATKAGVFAGNFASAGPAPAHTGVFDYFFNAASPIAPEDGTVPGTPHTLTVTPSAGGSVSVDPLAATYYCSDVVTLTAVPDPGFAFTGWSGDVTGSANPETVTLDADRTVAASFTPAVGPPVISNVQVEEFDNRATITWETNEPATSHVDYGLTAAYDGSANSGALVLQHSLTIFGLDALTTYHFSVSSTDGDLDTASTVDDTFTTLAAVEGPFDSDDFNTCTLDPVWSFVNPLGDASYRVVGGGSGQAELRIEVPAGNSHDAWITNQAPRLMQPVDGNPDFQVEVKFDSQVSLANQFQGLIVEDTAAHWLRFDVLSNGTQTRVFAAKMVNGTPTALIDQLLVNGASPVPLWLRVTRSGNNFTTETSLNGSTWTQAPVTGGGFSFADVLTVRKIGVAAGNAVSNPKHTAKFDYFFETSVPVVPEDGLPVGGTGYELAVNTVGTGTLSVDPDRDLYYCNEDVALTAVPGGGSVFTGWSGDLAGIANPETLTMSADRSVTASFASDTIPPVIDQITVTPGDTFADVCWITNEAANSRVDFGVFAPDEGSGSSAAFVTQHCVRITGLVADTDYFFTVTSVDQEALATTSPTDSFRTLAQAGPFESDDFNRCALDLGLWSFVNPLGDASFSLSGAGTANARMSLVVPSGAAHDAYNTNTAPRLMQSAANTDFQIEVKLESVLNAGNQFEGIFIEQNATNWVRVDFVATATQYRLFAASTAAGVTTARIDLLLGSLPAAGPRWLRVTRAGNTFTVEHSANGSSWTNAGNFAATLSVTKVGVFAGNAVNNPAHTAVFDYFFDGASPIVPEDGGVAADGKVLTTAVVGGGSIQRNPDQAFYCGGGSVQLTAVPQQNWVFSGWSGDLTGTTNPAPVSMSQNRSVTATFVPPANCGNGALNGGEQCDDGNNAPGDGCSAVCLIEGCGNGAIDGGEQCDDANGVLGDGCRPDCTAEVCGDSILDPGEQCDDGAGNADVADTCRTDCQLPDCGDGIVDTGEQCDDGNAVNGDGCQVTCELPEAGFVLAYGFEEPTGVATVFDVSGHGRNGTLVGPGARTSAGLFGRAVNFAGAGGSVSMGTLDLAGTGLTISMWVRANDFGIADARLISKATGVNVADHSWMISTQPVTTVTRLRGRLKTAVGGTTEIVATSGDLSALTWTYVSMTYDGTNLKLFKDCVEVGSVAKTGAISQNAAATALIGDQPAGGGKSFDGRIDEVRILDFAETPAQCAVSMATPVACGNGVIDGSFETCDDGNNASGDGCSAVCVREPACGDGFLDAGEACDDSNTANGDCCSATCSFESAVSACEDGLYCTVSDTCNGSGACTSGGPRNCADADVCTDDSCDEPADICRHEIDLTNDPSCTTCGDGVQEGLEQCDDSNTSSGDGCSATCQDEFCGDGVTQAGLGEQCDQGAGNSDTTPNACRTDCQSPVCGDNVVDSGETCDDGNASNTDACLDTCVPATCGDGFVRAGVETCDDGNGSNTDACLTTCVPASCGDGFVQTGVETCDDGNTASGDGCSATCGSEVVCGNATIDAGETCDDGNAISGDGCSATCDRLVSDLFDAASLNTVVWTEVDPRNDTPVDQSGGKLRIPLPSGTSHDPWPTTASFTGNNDSVRVLQNADNSNFRVVVKLDSTVGTAFTSQGILVEQDANNWMRFDVYSNDTQWYIFAAKVVPDGADVDLLPDPVFFINVLGGSGVGAPGDSPVPLYLRVTRTGNSWTFERSTNGFAWTSNGPAHVHALTVNRVGVFAGNFKSPGTPPAHTGLFDFFMETSACGNGTVNADETCDDGNTVNTDACLNNCTPNVCGDGILDSTEEQCDDANTVAGDCCSATCTFESPGSTCSDGLFCNTGETCNGAGVCGGGGANCLDADICTDDACNETLDTCTNTFDGTNDPSCAVCGNGALEPPEACDDGDTDPGDGCSATCTIETVCGNGSLEAGEACDDGDLVDGDGCDSNCTVTACGNGVVTGTEECDEGASNSDTNPDACRTNCENPSCGDAVTDSGEACDDGNAVEGDGCDSNCTASACGNGIVGGTEACDDGNAVNGDGCDTNCTLTACGNGIVTAGEACDDGDTESGDGCSATCTTEAVCGNGGAPEAGEGCDDGNLIDGDGCDSNCTLTGCGNGIVTGTETCDDGNAVNGDGCDTNCTATACGNGIVTGSEACDDGNAVNGDGCDTNCTATACGNGIVTGSEACDDGNAVNGDGCDTNCTATACGNGIVSGTEACDDGNAVNGDGCDTNCTATACGNGIVTGTEVCDDGNAVNGDGCDTNCTATACGNGIVTAGEACDDGDTDSGDGCSATCTIEAACGDGTLDPGEKCDDGNTTPGDGCSATCKGLVDDEFNAASFDTALWTEIDPLVDSTVTQSAGKVSLAVPGSASHDLFPPNTNGLRIVQDVDNSNFQIVAKLDSVMTVVGAGRARSNGFYVEQDASNWARFDVYRGSTSWAAYGARVVGGTLTQFFNVAGGLGDSPAPLLLRLTRAGTSWRFESSSNNGTTWTIHGTGVHTMTVNRVGVWAGNTASGGTPAHTATFDYFHGAVQFCGDGTVQGGLGETCDDGNNSNADGCLNTCVANVCGDGFVNTGVETCDDGGTTSGNGCSATCTVETGYSCAGTPSVCSGICGDGLLRGAEACDQGNTTPGDGCSATCTVEAGWSCPGEPSVCSTTCGDGIPAGAEACDDGGTTSGNGCSATCTVETGYSCAGTPSVCSGICGDGLLRGAEACDQGNTTPGDGCSATCTVEAGWSCPGEPSVCSTTCGDGIPVGAEACDDGGTTSGNGCSATCTVETGYSCAGTPSVCSGICGDGLVRGLEACDQGNTAPGDGCSATCTVEAGWSCPGEPSVCSTTCGDGIPVGAEACDDGGTTDADGCSSTCTVESGFTCSGTPSVCSGICGDGLVRGLETCDEGNAAPGDGCSATCTVEAGWSCPGEPSTCSTTCGDGIPAGAEGCDDGDLDDGDGCSSTCAVEAGFSCSGTPSVCQPE